MQAFGQSLGPALSSTRQEAIAIYASVALPGPRHCGVDNQSAINRANEILAGNCGRRPWGMQDDGDVWQVFAQETAAKGVTSLQLSKVKGHAKASDVQAGKSTHQLKVGNDGVEDAVNRAMHAQRKAQHEVVRLLDQRWRHVELVVSKI